MTPSLPSLVVLVVEDELLVLLDTAEHLRSYGCEVVEASNADEALRLMEQRSDIALVFTDVNMPGSMDGLRLAKTIALRRPKVHIIVTSAKPAPGKEELPANGQFIAKPYAPEQVALLMQKLMTE